MKTLYLVLSLIFFYNLNFAQDNIEIDSNIYPWYSPSLNYFQFYSKNSLSSFYDALQNVKKNKVSIIHFGDSHIQSEIPTNETRLLLQKKYGNGGRGLIFPYSTAKTYSSIHYSTRHTGNWSYSKTIKPTNDIPLGIMGMSSKTVDSTASFTITFNSKVPSNNILLKLYCEVDSLSYDIIIESDGKSTPIDINSSNGELQNGYVSVTLPSVSNTITFKCLKTATSQKQFILHGFELLNTENKGLIYYSSGVGGAKFNSLLSIDNFNNELKAISPDLVILDFGTNDFLYSDSVKNSLEIDIKNVISLIRKSSPLVSIVICSTQDLYYKQKNLTATEQYSSLIKKIAKETEIAYWDWYAISGGKGSLKVWLNQGLAKNDMIHLTNIGYRIKGKLLFEAIENTKNLMFKSPDQNELIISSTPKKLDSLHLEKNQNQINSLSNRELIQNEKNKPDSVIKNDFQTQILIQDSIEISKNLASQNTIIKDSITTASSTIKTPPTQDLKTDSLNALDTKEIPEKNIVKNTDSVKVAESNISKTTADVLRPKHQAEKIISNDKDSSTIDTKPKLHETPIQNTQNTTQNFKQNKNIKVELYEDFNDSTLAILEESKRTANTKKNIKTNKKTYEIARERQHQMLDHDTLAVKIISDSISKPKQKQVVKQPIKPKNIVYKVKSGDNLSFIAEKFNVKVSDIKTWNRLNNDNLSLGQTLIIKR